MAKITDRFIIAEVGQLDFVGEKETPKQRIVLFKPSYVDDFGDKKGRDEYWPVDIIGNKVEALNIHERHVNQRVEATLYVTGNRFKKSDETVGYALNANLAEIKMISAPTQAQQNNGQEPDLPF